MHSKYRAQGYFQPGLLFKFTPAGVPDIFAPLHMTAGNTPHTRIGSRSPGQKQSIIFHVYYRHSDRRVAILNFAAMVAIESLTGTDGFDLQLSTAMGTEFKLHRPASGLKKSPEGSGLCKNTLLENWQRQ
jgi:hypothetical protein